MYTQILIFQVVWVVKKGPRISNKPIRPIPKLKREIVRPRPREIIREALSARRIKAETSSPFSPSVIIIPTMKKKPKTPENRKPDSNEAEIENKAIWLKVSKDKAKSAPIDIICRRLHFFVLNFFAK